VEPAEQELACVDCQELPLHFIRPEVGQRLLWGFYGSPDHRLEAVWDLSAHSRARIHGVPGVAIDVQSLYAVRPITGEYHYERLYGTMDEQRTRILAAVVQKRSVLELSTFLDGEFDLGADAPRMLWERGRWRLFKDGTLYRQADGMDWGEVVGTVEVLIGDQRHRCLRLVKPASFDTGRRLTEHDCVYESFVAESGRTVLVRKYFGSRYALQPGGRSWERTLKNAERLVVEDLPYIHRYDWLPHHVLAEAAEPAEADESAV
jgi:hypothetical protein